MDIEDHNKRLSIDEIIRSVYELLDENGALMSCLAHAQQLAAQMRSKHNAKQCQIRNCVCRTFQQLSRNVADGAQLEHYRGVLGLKSAEKLVSRLHESKLSIEGKDYSIVEAYALPQYQQVALQFLNFQSEELFGDPARHFAETEKQLTAAAQFLVALRAQLVEVSRLATPEERLAAALALVAQVKLFLAETSAGLLDIGKFMFMNLFRIVSELVRLSQTLTEQALVVDHAATLSGVFVVLNATLETIFSSLRALSPEQFEALAVARLTPSLDEKHSRADIFLPFAWR